jgi:hypothetical protein
VVDDSRSPEHAARNGEITAAASRLAAVGLHYFGAAEARELMGALVRQLPQHEDEMRFLLDRERWQDHKSYGLARNFSHLLSVGKPVVVFDDDTLCEVYDAPFHKAGVAFAAGQQEAEFYPDNAEWRAGLSRVSRDPVAGHMQCLGLALPEALSALGLARLEQTALRAAPRDFAARLGRDSRVVITECGSLGDPGTGSNRWLASVPAASRERLVSRDGRLRLALEQRCCWLGRERPEFRPGGSISQVTGFDNRGLLPPYFPITRGEDRLFGRMTGYIYPGSVTLEYPWAVPHLPLQERKWADDDNRYTVSTRFPGTLVNRFFHNLDDCLAADPPARLAFLGRLFEDLAAAPDEVLLSRFADDRHGFRAAQLRNLQEMIAQSTGLPADWRAYLGEALRQVRSSALGEFGLDEVSGTVGALKGRALVCFWREAWRSFGRSLLAWSKVRDAARELVQKKYST